MRSPTNVNTNKYKFYANKALTQYVQMAEHLRTQILRQKFLTGMLDPKRAAAEPVCAPTGASR